MSSNKVSFISGIRKVVVPTSKGIRFIWIDRIHYIRSENIYSILVMEDSEIIVFSTLLSLEKVLTGPFVRVHKSYLVNINMIDTYLKIDGGCILLASGESIPVSRQKRVQFLNHIELR